MLTYLLRALWLGVAICAEPICAIAIGPVTLHYSFSSMVIHTWMLEIRIIVLIYVLVVHIPS